MSSENTPKTPANQPVKRLSVLSPFSAASPQHRRPSKILRDVNEKVSQSQEKAPYPIFQPYEADPNIEMTLCEQSTMVEPSAEENRIVNQLELSTRTLTGDDTPTASDLTEQCTPNEETEPDTDVGTSGPSINEVESLDNLKIESVEITRVEPSLAEEQAATISANSNYSGVDETVSSESTSGLFPVIEMGLSLADELAALDNFDQSPMKSEESRGAESAGISRVSEDFEKEETLDEMTDVDQEERSEGPMTDKTEVETESTEKSEELATEVSGGIEEECNQSTLEDIITAVMNESVANMDEGEEEPSSDVTSTDIHYSAIGELCPIQEESPSQPLSNRQLRHISDTSLLNRTTSLSDSLAEFVTLEKNFESEGNDALAETYQKMAKDAQAMAQELENKLAKMEKALELALKERDDYQYLHETEVKKNKKEASSLRQRCHELENELESVQQKQLSESAISGLEDLGEKLDLMMKESVVLTETKDRLEKELQAANDRVEELVKANEECLEQKTMLEDELQLRDGLLVQAQAEVERLSAVKDEEMEEALSKVTSEMTAEIDGYKRQLEETQITGEELQKKAQMEREDREKLMEEFQSEVKLREDAIASGHAEVERLVAACKAAEYAKEELQKMVNWLQENGTDSHRQEMEQLDAKLAQSAELNSKMEAELESLKEKLNEAVHHKDIDMTSARKQLEESENRTADLESEIESYKSQLEEARSTLATVENEKDEALHRCELRSSEIDLLRKQLEDMETELTKKYKVEKELELMVEKLTEEKKQLEEEKIDSGEIESYQKQLKEAQELLVKLNQEKRDLSGYLEELKEELRAKEESLVLTKNEIDRLLTSLEEAERRKEELIQVAGDLNTKMIRLEEENTAIGMYKLELEEAKRQEILREQKCRELEVELENLRQKQLLEGQLEEMKKLMMEGFDRVGDRLVNNKEEPKEAIAADSYKAELDEAREEIEKHLKTISQLESELEKEKKEAARALKMCDEMDDLEDEYNQRIGKLVEEVDRLKVKCGEVEKTGGLLQALRPENVSQLSPGSVHNSMNNMTVAPVASPNLTAAPVASPKTPARGGAEKTFLDPMENTKIDSIRSPATNNTCRQQ